MRAIVVGVPADREAAAKVVGMVARTGHVVLAWPDPVTGKEKTVRVPAKTAEREGGR